jgi:hypothetical protein
VKYGNGPFCFLASRHTILPARVICTARGCKSLV